VRPLRRADRPSPGRPITVTVVHGTLRWGYHVAATLRDVTITRTRRGGTLSGGVVTFNRAQTGTNGAVARQPPLYFVTLITGGAWQWPVKRLEIDAKTVRADLGPQE
jgi:hypothetical protein